MIRRRRHVVPTVKRILGSASGELAFYRAINSKPAPKLVQQGPFSVDKSYFFTSNSGVYRLAPEGIYRIIGHKSYGITMDSDAVYLSMAISRYSVVGAFDRQTFSGNARDFGMRGLLFLEVLDLSDRIHGLSMGKTGLWVANTGRNTVLLLDPSSGDIIRETALFSDRFGTPLYYNVNHINSVTAVDGGVLFVANRAGNSSLLGVLEDRRITCFAYPNPGVHDIFVPPHGFYFCDSFGPMTDDHFQGRLVSHEGVIDPSFFVKRSMVIRGIAGSPDAELLVGNSFRGTRSTRFSGKGSILVIRSGKVDNEIPLDHSAQVYQIVEEHSGLETSSHANVSTKESRKRLEAVLGKAVIDEEAPEPNRYAIEKWICPSKRT